jgi:hypothetical protein
MAERGSQGSWEHHVAQSVGHTVLHYRPGMPPVIDLGEIGKHNCDEDTNDSGVMKQYRCVFCVHLSVEPTPLPKGPII